MLHGLRGGDQRCVEHLLVFDFANDLVGFFQNAVDGRAIDRFGLHAVHLEDLLDALDMSLGFLKVLLEALTKRGIGRLVDHLGQILLDLHLGVIDVAQRMHEQIVERLDVF